MNILKEKPFLAGLGTILIWSSLAAISTRLSNLPPFFLTGSALLLGGLISLPKYHLWTWNFHYIFIGGVAVFSYHFALFMAFRTGPPVECNLINYLWPLLIVLLSPLFEKQHKLKLIHIFGVILGFSGAVIAISGKPVLAPSGFYIGYFLAFCSALIWSSYSLYLKRFKNISSFTMGLVCILSGLFSLTTSFAINETIQISSDEITFLAILGIGPLGIAFYLWDYAMKNTSSQRIGTLTYLTPILSTIWLVLATGRTFEPQLLIALVFVITGAILGRRQ